MRHFGNVSRHGQRDGFEHAGECDGHAEVSFAQRPYFELVSVGFQSLDEMIGVGLVGVAHAKVVNHEREHDVARDVSEETRTVGALDVAMSAEVPDETGLAELAGLREAIHAFSYFKVDVPVMQ